MMAFNDIPYMLVLCLFCNQW